MTDEKKDYEISFLAKEESGATKVADAVRAEGGEITLEGQVNKMPLAYEINKETVAFFGFFHFSSLPSGAKKLEEDLKHESDILRYMIITPPFVKNKPRPSSKPKPSAKPPTESKSASLSNEAIEKKIEEILNQQ